MKDRIQEVQHFITENLGEPLNTRILADVACLSPVHFHRSFKATTGLTPALYVELHKIKQSLELLKEGVQVQDAAFQLGYANYETFSRTFKKHCTIAPHDLQCLLRRLEGERNPESPLLLSASRSLQDLGCLLKEAVEGGTVRTEELHALQLCILSPKEHPFRSRNATAKFELYFEAALCRQLLQSIQL